MKKLAIIMAIALVLGVILYGCHGQKNCPAYGKTEEAPTETNV